MGREVVKAIQQDSAFKLVGCVDNTLGKSSLIDEIKTSQAKIVVDFTTATAAFKNAKIIIESGAHPVIGTTGFLPDQIEELKNDCAKKKLGGVIAPNFSISAVLMMQFAAQAAKHFSHAEIIEMHHQAKEDSPSGTAMLTAELIAAKRNNNKTTPKTTRETIPGARGASHLDIPIHAVRLPGMVAHQMVMFGGHGETLTLRSDTINRECYMPGVLLACKKVVNLSHLVYGLENLL
jgi:4-hydroxy-tetrahydrodipicolinate reductase